MVAQPLTKQSTIAERWLQVQQRVVEAANRAGRNADDVTIIAVSKTVDAARVVEAVRAGAIELGENRLQEAREKIHQVHNLLTSDSAAPTPRWHLIGHLQRNKVKYIFDHFVMVHSVDTLELAVEIDRRAAARGQVMPILLEVNISAEASKDGLRPEDVEAMARRVEELEHVRLRGLMTIPPLTEDAEMSRPIYQSLRALAAELRALDLPTVRMEELSMGMTHDFEVAVEEGATMVRIGTAIFGARPSG